MSMTRGRHQFGFGVRLAEARTRAVYGTNVTPSFAFSGAATGLGLADFLTGQAASLTQGISNEIHARMKYVSFYGQDTWQVKPRLSVSYGLRWSPILPQQDERRPVPMVLNFDLKRYTQGLRSTVFVNAPPGLIFPGDPGFAQKNNGANAAKPMSDVFNPYWKDFAPRVGFAWDGQGDGRTSIRVSYGLSYEDYPANFRLGTQRSEPPWGALTRLLAPVGGLDDPWRGIPGGNPFPLQLTKDMPFVPAGDYVPNNPYLSPTYTQSWNLSIQREVVPGTLVSASYLGTGIVNTQAATPLNLAIFVPGVGDANDNCFLNGQATHFKVAPGTACSTVTNTQARRTLSFLNPASAEIGRLAIITSSGTQSYNGMLLSVQRRATNGVTVNANYTLSHCIGDYAGRSNSGYGSGVNHSYQDPNNRRKDRGNCESDQRHNFNLTAVAETPKFANRTLNLVGTGWRLSGLYRASTSGNLVASNQSSGPRTVTIGSASTSSSSGATVDRCLCDVSNQRPDLLLPNAVYLDNSGRPGTQYLNPAAFGVPALGTLGNLGRATLKLPPTWQFDVALSRVFRFRESQTMEFRAEAFNVLNSFRPGVIDTNLSSAQFGRIRTALDPRILQFALKYLF